MQIYKLRKVIITLLILLLIFTFNLSISGCKKEVSEPFNYKILQLADPQFGASLNNSQDTVDLITYLVNTTTPDLIVITGDLVSSFFNDTIYQQFVDFLDTFKIPYAIAFGNHDSEGNAGKAQIVEIVESGEYSVFEEGPDITGAGNYIINLNNSNGEIAWSLVMFDSNEYYGEGYDYIHEDQIDWYSDSITSLKADNGGQLNSLAFFHIPLQEYNEAWGKKDTEEVIYYFGDKREGGSPSDINSGLFDTMKELDSTRGIFVGHDHINDYSLSYQGIRLTYGLKSGHGSYHNDDLLGGLLITLSDNDYTVEQVFSN